MKRFFFPSLLIILFPLIGISQNGEYISSTKNAIIITPLGDLVNNSKSSIYFRRKLKNDSKKILSIRIGTELFNSIDNEFSTGRKEKTSYWNLKTGLEIGKRFDKMIIYFGPEVSYTASSINSATLFPSTNAIFSKESFVAEEWDAIDETTMSIFSIIGFVGFKYKLTKSIFVGVESAVGIGWYKSDQRYDSDLSFPQGDQHTGVIKDLSVNRFFLLEYNF